jgi:hypothetical protein
MEVVNSIGAPLDAGFRELRFQDDENVIRAVRTCLREQETSWYKDGMRALVSRWCKAVRMELVWKHNMCKGNIQLYCV